MNLRGYIPVGYGMGILLYDWAHIPVMKWVGIPPLSPTTFAVMCIALGAAAGVLGVALSQPAANT